jgi:hypothetical protein
MNPALFKIPRISNFPEDPFPRSIYDAIYELETSKMVEVRSQSANCSCKSILARLEIAKLHLYQVLHTGYYRTHTTDHLVTII